MGKKLLAGLVTWALILGMTTPGQATPLTITELSSADVFHRPGSDQEWNTKFPINPGTGRVEFPWGYVIVDLEDIGSNPDSLIFESIAITGQLGIPLSLPDVSMTITAGTINAGTITVGSGLRVNMPDSMRITAGPITAGPITAGTITVGSGLRANIPDNWDHQPLMSSGPITIIGLDYTQPEIPVGSIQLERQAPSPVPEPATMLLFGTGLAGLAGARLRKKW